MDIGGHTLPFAVLGHPIGHSLSPPMHNASFRALGLDAIYLAFDVHPDRLMDVLPAMREMGFRGVNLTVPLKEVACRGIDDLDDTARRLGAVNTVAFPDGGMKGYNTDCTGFLLALEEAFDLRVAGLSVFVLGCGGAGRAVALTCAAEGARRVLLADVDKARVQRLAGEVGAHLPGDGNVVCVDTHADAWTEACSQAELVVQATPVGMKEGEPSLLPPGAFREGQCAFDLVYMYPQTPFMQAAEAGGARAANGLGMLLHQGAHAFTIWTGKQASVADMRGALEQAVYGRR